MDKEKETLTEEVKEEAVEETTTEEVEETSVEIDETKKETEGDSKKKKKPKKEHGNGFKFFVGILIIVVTILGYLLITGQWNPFKSREPEKQAVENYENSLEASHELWKELDCGEYDPTLGDYGAIPHDFAPDGRFPYGFEILEDNGKEGKNGVLKAMTTADSSYCFKYGLNFDVYYMKNNDYAKEQYIALKNSASGINSYRKEFEGTNCKVTIARRFSDEYIMFFVKYGTTLYEMYGHTENFSKMQALFDTLNIDLKIPSLEKLQ